MSGLVARISGASDTAFDKYYESWCEEAEKSRDFHAFALLMIGRDNQAPQQQQPSSSSQHHQQSRSNRLLAFVLDAVEKTGDKQAITAIEQVLSSNPSRLAKSHGRLYNYFKTRIEVDASAARCFACLPGCLSNRLCGEEFKKTFELLVEACLNAVRKKNLTAFECASSGIILFLKGAGRETASEFEVRPDPIAKVCRDAVDINSEFTIIALTLLPEIARRLGRVALPWAGICCDTLELAFDNSNDSNDERMRNELRRISYSTAADFINMWGLGIGVRLAKSMLCKAVKVDWSVRNTSSEEYLIASQAAIVSIFTSGAATILPSKIRGELDQAILAASEQFCLKNISTVGPLVRADFVRLLHLCLRTPVEGVLGTTITRPSILVLRKIVSHKRESPLVLEHVKSALATINSSGAAERRIAVTMEPSATGANTSFMGKSFGSEEEEDEDGDDARASADEAQMPAEEESAAAPSMTEDQATKPSSTVSAQVRAVQRTEIAHKIATTAATSTTTSAKKPRYDQTQPDSSDDDSDIPEIV